MTFPYRRIFENSNPLLQHASQLGFEYLTWKRRDKPGICLRHPPGVHVRWCIIPRQGVLGVVLSENFYDNYKTPQQNNRWEYDDRMFLITNS